MKRIAYILLYALLFFQGGTFELYAQEEEPSKEEQRNLRQSKDLTYEANNELDEDLFAEAEATYRKAIAKSDQNATARYNLGNAYYKNNSLGEAFMRYKEA